METNKCKYKHHVETYGKELICPKCKGPMECGPFDHGCRKCTPFKFEPCGICGAQRIYCTC